MQKFGYDLRQHHWNTRRRVWADTNTITCCSRKTARNSASQTWANWCRNENIRRSFKAKRWKIMEGKFAGVIINRLALNIDRMFHYSIPTAYWVKLILEATSQCPLKRKQNCWRICAVFVKPLRLWRHVERNLIGFRKRSAVWQRNAFGLSVLKQKYFCSYISAVKPFCLLAADAKIRCLTNWSAARF